MPPDATSSPSLENSVATTESVWPVNLMGVNVEELKEDEEAVLVSGWNVSGMGQKMYAKSSSPPEMARGGLGNDG